MTGMRLMDRHGVDSRDKEKHIERNDLLYVTRWPSKVDKR